MKCPKCKTEMILAVEDVNPIRRRVAGCPPQGSITYRDVYYCPECNSDMTVKVYFIMDRDCLKDYMR